MAPEAKGKGKKILGLNPLAWAGIGVGGIGIVYYLHKRSTAAAAAAATGLTDANTAPAADSTSATTTPPATLAAWINDALGTSTTATYTNTNLLNDINEWLGGNCVSAAGYSAIGNLVSTLGVPPGYSTTPTLSVCSSSTGTLGGGTGVNPGGPMIPATTPNTDPAVLAAINAVTNVPTQIITNIAQGQNATQASNNANATLPTLSPSQAEEYLATTGSNYGGPQTLSAAQQATMPTIGANGLPVGGDETIG